MTARLLLRFERRWPRAAAVLTRGLLRLAFALPSHNDSRTALAERFLESLTAQVAVLGDPADRDAVIAAAETYVESALELPPGEIRRRLAPAS